MAMFKPGAKVRRKPEYQYQRDWWTLGDRVLTVSGHSPVHPCEIFLDGVGGSWHESCFDLVEDAPVKAFGTLSDDEIKVGETHWLDSFIITSGSDKKGNEVNTEVEIKDGDIWHLGGVDDFAVIVAGSKVYASDDLRLWGAHGDITVLYEFVSSSDATLLFRDGKPVAQTDPTEAHKKDVQTIADRLFKEAEERKWRSEWDDVRDELNELLTVKLEKRKSEVEKFWDEFEFRHGDVVVCARNNGVPLRYAISSGVGTWSDGYRSSAILGRLVDGRSVLVRDGKIVTPNV